MAAMIKSCSIIVIYNLMYVNKLNLQTGCLEHLRHLVCRDAEQTHFGNNLRDGSVAELPTFSIPDPLGTVGDQQESHTSARLDHADCLQLIKGFEHRAVVDPQVGGELSHRGYHFAGSPRAVENAVKSVVNYLPVDRFIVIKLYH